MNSFKVYVRSMDGRHLLGRYKTYDRAKARADDWLGANCTWINEYRAIMMYGDVLTIEESSGPRPKQKCCSQCRSGEIETEADYFVTGKIQSPYHDRMIPYRAYICDDHLTMLEHDGAELTIIDWVGEAEHKHAIELMHQHTGWTNVESFLNSRPTLRLFPEARWLQNYWNNYNTFGERVDI